MSKNSYNIFDLMNDISRAYEYAIYKTRQEEERKSEDELKEKIRKAFNDIDNVESELPSIKDKYSKQNIQDMSSFMTSFSYKETKQEAIISVYISDSKKEDFSVRVNDEIQKHCVIIEWSSENKLIKPGKKTVSVPTTFDLSKLEAKFDCENLVVTVPKKQVAEKRTEWDVRIK